MGEEGNTESDQSERPLKKKNPKCFFVQENKNVKEGTPWGDELRCPISLNTGL